MKTRKISAVGASAIAAALAASGSVLAQATIPAMAGQQGPATLDAVTQPGTVDSLTREELRVAPFGAAAPAANPLPAVQSGIPFAIPSAETGAAGLTVGPGTVYPDLGLTLRYDDNIFFTDANKKSSVISVVTPIVRYEMRGRNATYDLIYKGDYASYWDSSADNYNDHYFLAQGNWAMSSRAGFRLRAEYVKSHDARGSTDRPNSNEPDRFDAKSVTALFGYGAPGARGRVELEGGYLEKRYQNNRAVTTSADRDVGFTSAAFLWRVMPKTSLRFQVRETDIDYKVDTTRLDSSELRFLVGATWDATAKLTGLFHIGQVRKNFDATTREDFRGVGWEGSLRWSPLTYSTITVSTSREPTESSGTGDFILSQIYYLTWSHAWTERTISAVNVGYREDAFRGAGNARRDDIATTGFRLSYRIRRWLRLSGEYTYTDRQSNAPFVEYGKNLFMLSLGATL